MMAKSSKIQDTPDTADVGNHEAGQTYFDVGADSPVGRNPDKVIWMVWAILLVVAVIALPFIARQSEILTAIADACLTLIGS